MNSINGPCWSPRCRQPLRMERELESSNKAAPVTKTPARAGEFLARSNLALRRRQGWDHRSKLPIVPFNGFVRLESAGEVYHRFPRKLPVFRNALTQGVPSSFEFPFAFPVFTLRNAGTSRKPPQAVAPC